MKPIPVDVTAVSFDSIMSIEPIRFKSIVSTIRSCHGLTAGIGKPEGQALMPLAVRDGVATVTMVGPMEKRPSFFGMVFGFVSTEMVRRAVEAAAADQSVNTILLHIDSPGGSVDGLAELGDAVFEARKTKQVIAQIDGIGASAAFYVASQATKVFAGRMDLIGSIGTKLVIWDMSKLFEEAGVEVLTFDTGELKSAGEPGTVVTDEQKDFFQGIVDGFFKDFVKVVARGRGMSEAGVRAVADGRVVFAREAVKLGLIDKVQTLDETVAKLSGRRSAGKARADVAKMKVAKIGV